MLGGYLNQLYNAISRSNSNQEREIYKEAIEKHKKAKCSQVEDEADRV
jgi:hypothetical protein